MNTRTLLATTLAAAVAATTASVAAPATTALVSCGKIKAGGTTWQVAAGGVRCAIARGVVRKVAAKKPDQVLHVQGGEIDRYAASFSGLKCFKSRKAKVAAINCSSSDGKKSVLGVHQG